MINEENLNNAKIALEADLGIRMKLKTKAELVASSINKYSISSNRLVKLTTKTGCELLAVVRDAEIGSQGFEFEPDAWREILWAHREGRKGDTRPAAEALIVWTDRGAIAVEEFRGVWLIERFVLGDTYANLLQNLSSKGEDVTETKLILPELIDWLRRLHSNRVNNSKWYQRRLRNLVGAGDGFLGVIDSYYSANETPDSQVNEWLIDVERSLPLWRHELRRYSHRLCRIHGDYHPWNIIVSPKDCVRVIDSARDGWGDPADDVAALGVNYLFFGIQASDYQSSWLKQFQEFISGYVKVTQDKELIKIIPPFLAHRLIVLGSPQWYPNLSQNLRRKFVGFARELIINRNVLTQLNQLVECAQRWLFAV